jgi:hypothetical protein
MLSLLQDKAAKELEELVVMSNDKYSKMMVEQMCIQVGARRLTWSKAVAVPSLPAAHTTGRLEGAVSTRGLQGGWRSRVVWMSHVYDAAANKV